MNNKKYVINVHIIDNLDATLSNVDSGYILETKDEWTLILNEMAAYIIKLCDKPHSIEDIACCIEQEIYENKPNREEIISDITLFVESLMIESLLVEC